MDDDVGATVLGRWERLGLAAGASYTQAKIVPVPGVPSGSYYLFVDVDGDAALHEASETNNRRMVPIAVTTPQGAQLTGYGDVVFADGTVTQLYDAELRSNDVDTRYAGESGRAPWQGPATPNLKKDTRYSVDGVTCQPGLQIVGGSMGIVLKKFPTQVGGPVD